MSRVWIASDMHLGHNSITRYRPQFSTAEDHHNTMIENVCSAVGKRDTLILLGDIAFKPEWLEKFTKALVCNKTILVPGNHDVPMKLLVEHFTDVTSFISRKNVWLSHCPIHPDELRGRLGNIHGHTHNHNIPDTRYFNASMENINYRPILWEDAVEQLNASI